MTKKWGKLQLQEKCWTILGKIAKEKSRKNCRKNSRKNSRKDSRKNCDQHLNQENSDSTWKTNQSESNVFSNNQMLVKVERSTQTDDVGNDLENIKPLKTLLTKKEFLTKNKIENVEQETQTDNEPSNPMEELIIAVNERDLFVLENENLEEERNLLSNNYDTLFGEHESLKEDHAKLREKAIADLWTDF